MSTTEDVIERAAGSWAKSVGREARIASATPLTGGTANDVARVEFADGQRVIVKVGRAPKHRLAHETELLRTEAFALRTLGRAAVTQPEVLFFTTVDAREALVMTELSGIPATNYPSLAVPSLTTKGEMLSKLHRAGSFSANDGAFHFGYPFREHLQASTLAEAYLKLIDAVLADASKYGVDVPRSAAHLMSIVSHASDAFDEVTSPTLVHFDLWDGNLLVSDGCFTGLIDHERALWADPTADLVSFALMNDASVALPKTSKSLLGAYAERTGVNLLEGEAACIRTRLWSVYMALIMLVEAIPRGYSRAESDSTTQSIRETLYLCLSRL